RDLQSQHAVLVDGRGALDIEARRQRQGTAAAAATDFTVDALTVTGLALGLLLDRDGQVLLVDGDLDIVGTHTGQSRFDGDGILAGADVQRQSRLGEAGPRAERRLLEEA